MTKQSAAAHPSSETIPWVDMGHFLSGTFEQKQQVAHLFGSALKKIGFVAVTNVGLTPALIDKAYEIIERYFNLPEDIKLKCRAIDGHNGFTPFGTEHAKYTEIVDLKEFYQTTGPTQPAAAWPNFPDFKETMNALYLELESCMKYCLQATAIYLGYTKEGEQNILSDMLGHGAGVMRTIHYPPVDPERSPPGAVRSAPHEDLGIMTVIPRATHAGLQVKNNNGEWLDVVVPEGAAIINSADVLSRISNGVIPSTTHRVINPPTRDFSHRYSIPFFGNLPANTVLRVLEKCKKNTAPDAWPAEITFKEFFDQRYREIGLTK